MLSSLTDVCLNIQPGAASDQGRKKVFSPSQKLLHCVLPDRNVPGMEGRNKLSFGSGSVTSLTLKGALP